MAAAGPVTLRPAAGTLLQGSVPCFPPRGAFWAVLSVSLLSTDSAISTSYTAYRVASNTYYTTLPLTSPTGRNWLLVISVSQAPVKVARGTVCGDRSASSGHKTGTWCWGARELHAVAQSQLRQKYPCPWAPLPVSLQRSLCFGGRRVSGEVRRSGERATCRWQTSRSRHLPPLPSQEETPCGGQDQRHRRPKPQHHAEIQGLRGHLGVWKTRQQMPGQRAHPTPSDKSSQ